MTFLVTFFLETFLYLKSFSIAFSFPYLRKTYKKYNKVERKLRKSPTGAAMPVISKTNSIKSNIPNIAKAKIGGKVISCF